MHKRNSYLKSDYGLKSENSDLQNRQTINYIKYTNYFITGLATVYFAYALVTGDQLVLPWETEATFKIRPLLLEYFELNGRPSGLSVDQVISWQKFKTGDLHYPSQVQNLLILAVLLALISVTTVVSYLERFRYFVVSGVVVFVLTQLRLEELGVWVPYLNYGVILGYAVLTYLFHSFWKAPLHTRFILTLLYYALLGSIIWLLPNMESPHWVALSFGILGPVALATLFILFIAGDNIYSLFRITTQGASTGKNGLLHFSVIGLFYVAMSALIFAQRIGYTEIDIYLINPYTFLLASIVSGFLAINRKMDLSFHKQLPLVKYWLYPAGATLTLVLLGYGRITANDSIVNALEWVIIISHFSYGTAFFIYALINFTPPLLENLSIYPAFFKGLRTPVSTVRLMAFILFLGGIFYLEYRPYYQAKAGQFTMLADVANTLGNNLLAQQYYKQSVYYDFYNFKANYALTRLAKKPHEFEEIPGQLNSILRNKHSPKARIALANFYADKELLYNEITTLMYSPETEYSPQVQNNLGIAHYKYSNYDSAFRYFELSANSASTSTVSRANLVALNYDFATQINFDSVFNHKEIEDINFKINKQALANVQRVPLDFNLAQAPDTLLQKDKLFYLYNAALSPVNHPKETILKTIDYYLQNDKNNSFKSLLLIAKAIALYGDGEVNKAFGTLNETIGQSQGTAGFPYFIKAVWAFDQGQANMTIEYLENAQKKGFSAPQLKKFVAEIRQIKDYAQKADISHLLENLKQQKSNSDSVAYRQALTETASKNAFDVKTTLSAIALLASAKASVEQVYDLLLEATEINPSSPEILEQYIYQCAKTGYRLFGQTALDKIKQMVPPREFDRIKSQFDRIISNR